MRYNGVAVAVTKCMEGAERFLLCFKKEGSAGPGFWGGDWGFCGYFLLLACQRLRLWQINDKAPITNDHQRLRETTHLKPMLASVLVGALPRAAVKSPDSEPSRQSPPRGSAPPAPFVDA